MLSEPLSMTDALSFVDQWADSLGQFSHLPEIVGAAIDEIDLGYDENDDIQLGGWRAVHPDAWDSAQVLDWIFSVARSRHMDVTELRAESFRTLRGLDLCRLNREDFLKKDPTNGEQLYGSLQQLLSTYSPCSDFSELTNIDFDLMSEMPSEEFLDRITIDDIQDGPLPRISAFLPRTSDLIYDIESVEAPTATQLCTTPQTSVSLDSGYESTDSASSPDMSYFSSASALENLPEVVQRVNNDVTSFDQSQSFFLNHDENFHDLNMNCNYITNSPLHTSYMQLSINPTDHTSMCSSPLSNVSDSSHCSANSEASVSSNQLSQAHNYRSLTGPRRPGRPRKNPGPANTGRIPYVKQQTPPSRKRPQGNKSTHLWEFMRTLLDDPKYNPSCIKWENEDLGVFRIVPGRSQDIAKLWGARKNNQTMTFDKLSRSLRWCRTYGFLAEVPKDRGYPKKLCFRFGAKALEWDKTRALSVLNACQRNALAAGSV